MLLPSKGWQHESNDLAQTYLNNLKAWLGPKEEKNRPCRGEAYRRGSL
jgi:hypothetical protein